jgi:hypothetical protein
VLRSGSQNSFTKTEAWLANCLDSPKTIEDLQAVLRIANKYSTPLWTFSRGKNIGYGGPAPRLPGSVALDLHRMDRILEVNEKFAYAVVEPGVTFTDLYDYCVKHKLKVWPSVPSLGWGSVVGNVGVQSAFPAYWNETNLNQQTLDRGMGFTPTAWHTENISGLEVMLADGGIVRTGQWAQTNGLSAHLSKFNFGPSPEGLFLQSNLAVVTKLTIWLTPQPQAYLSASFDMPNEEDVGPITEVFGEMRRNGLLPHFCYVFNIIEWSTFAGKRVDLYDKPGPMPDWRIREIQDRIGTGHWSVKFSLYGAKNVIQAQYDEVEKVLKQRLPSGKLQGSIFSGDGDRLLDPTSVTQPHGGMFVGVPSLWSLPLVSFMLPKDGSGAGAHSAYSAIIPLDGKVMVEWYKKATEIYQSEGFDCMCDFFMQARHAVFVCMLCFDKTNEQQAQAIERVFQKLYKEGNKRGFSKYRAHVDHMGELSSFLCQNSD